MIPILYEKNETAFKSNGICRLPDMISGTVTEERNGIFIAEFEYPVDGKNYSEIQIGRILFCSCSQFKKQPFEIYESSKPINGRVIFYARHLTYRGNFIPIEPFTMADATAVSVMNAMRDYHVMGREGTPPITCPFTFESTIPTLNTYKQDEPAALRSRLGGVEGSILDVYGGEYEWDYDFTNERPKIKLWAHRGQNTDVVIKYGKNLTDLQQEESIENMITGVVLFYKDEEGCVYSDVVYVPDAGGQYTTYPRIATIDVSGNYESRPDEEDLNAAAVAYLQRHDVGVPKINLDISFVNLADTEEYKNIAVLERVQLCDTVTVEFEKLGVNATAKVIRTVWNILLDRYDSIELGNGRTNISSVIAEQDNSIKDLESEANNAASMVDVQAAIDRTTQRITGASGGYVVFRDSNNDGKPDEILIMNTDNINTATKVWRWNQGGLGYSSRGYRPTEFDIAITQDGEIYADFITAGELNGDIIKGNSIATSKLTVESRKTLVQDEQYIYYASATNSAPTAPTTWITDVTGENDKWTAKRPQYSQAYKYCFSAKQKKNAYDTVSTTTPMLDETTTVIDGGSIITGSLDANKITTGVLSAASGVDTINFNTGAFSFANGNFKYDADVSKPYLELLNNLSLRLNDIPISGRSYTGIQAHSDITVIGQNVVEYPFMVMVNIHFSINKKTIAADSNLFASLYQPAYSGIVAPLINLSQNDFSQSFIKLLRIGYIHQGYVGVIRNTAQIGNSSAVREYFFQIIYPVNWNQINP